MHFVDEGQDEVRKRLNRQMSLVYITLAHGVMVALAMKENQPPYGVQSRDRVREPANQLPVL
jgi:hypothetical protein